MNRRDFIKNALTIATLLPFAKLFAGRVSVTPNSGNVSFDLLFTNVELYDGTGKPSFMADVAVKDDKIVQHSNRQSALE